MQFGQDDVVYADLVEHRVEDEKILVSIKLLIDDFFTVIPRFLSLSPGEHHLPAGPQS